MSGLSLLRSSLSVETEQQSPTCLAPGTGVRGRLFFHRQWWEELGAGGEETVGGAQAVIPIPLCLFVFFTSCPMVKFLPDLPPWLSTEQNLTHLSHPGLLSLYAIFLNLYPLGIIKYFLLYAPKEVCLGLIL